MTDIQVKTKAGFNNEGIYAKRGSTISVSESRAKQLRLNGLIEDFDMPKSSAPPENKSAAVPDNKSVPNPAPRRSLKPKPEKPKADPK